MSFSKNLVSFFFHFIIFTSQLQLVLMEGIVLRASLESSMASHSMPTNHVTKDMV